MSSFSEFTATPCSSTIGTVSTGVKSLSKRYDSNLRFTTSGLPDRSRLIRTLSPSRTRMPRLRRPRTIAPSTPVRPTALTPCPCKSSTMRLLRNPAYAISSKSIASLSE